MHQPVIRSAPRRRLLLVDDEVGICRTVPRLLQRQGFEVRVASSAIEAFTILEEDLTIGCAIVDLHLGGTTGLEIIGWLRARRAGVHLIIASGARPPELPEDVVFLSKPFTLAELGSAIGTA